MKRFLLAMAVIIFVPAVMGMGGILGDESPEKIPLPDDKFEAIFIDQMNVVTRCANVSIQGKTFIEGKKGEGTFAIPFENIARILFLMHDGALEGHIVLNDGNKMILTLKKDQKAYGKTKYGTFQIRLADLNKMTFTPGK
jgi:hypothetical protein